MWQVIQFVLNAGFMAVGGFIVGGWLVNRMANVGVPSATRKRIDAVDALQELGMSYGEAWDTVYEFQRRIGAE